jgi:DNA-binding NtrC family response regulator
MQVLVIAAPGSSAVASGETLLDAASLLIVPDLEQGVTRMQSTAFDAVLVGLPLPGSGSAGEVLDAIQAADSRVPVVFMDDAASVRTAVQVTRAGCFRYLDASTTADELPDAIAAIRARRRQTMRSAGANQPWREKLVGRSRAMESVAEVIGLVGSRRCTVLITGESGVGKEMTARAVHAASPRAHRPMVCVNCSALPENLLEAELFGHVKGAFTGAVNMRIGRFEQAHQSTLFLDEIGDMPLDLQAKLLRVLQEREFQRLGSSETIKVDVRVVAATNVDLLERVHQGRFREDLYYRLNVVPIRVPSLRDRPEDIPALVEHFIEKISREEGESPKSLAPGVIEALQQQDWPGNVRQLENATSMALALSGASEVLTASDFGVKPRPAAPKVMAISRPVADDIMPESGLDFAETVMRFERAILERAIQRAGGNKTAAADMLRLKRTTLISKLRSFELQADPRPYAVA